MGRARYTQAEIDFALGAMMASAALRDGEWVPNTHAVSVEIGVSCRTLERWWSARDIQLDATLRATTTRARESVMADGGRAWVESRWAAWRELMEAVTAPEAREGLSADKLARAGLMYRQALSGVEAEWKTASEGSSINNDRLQKLKRRAILSGLLE